MLFRISLIGVFELPGVFGADFSTTCVFVFFSTDFLTCQVNLPLEFFWQINTLGEVELLRVTTLPLILQLEPGLVLCAQEVLTLQTRPTDRAVTKIRAVRLMCTTLDYINELIEFIPTR